MSFSHEPVFLTVAEATALRAVLDQDSLIGRSLRTERDALALFMVEPVSVPGSGPGGGEAHEQHKRNYTMLFSAGRFWMMTGEARYAERVRDVLLQYASVYRQLPYAKPYSHNPPGRLFHQILNEHMWLLFASAGYSCVREWLAQAERELIEQNLFEPMVEMFTQTYAHHFDIIHNHGMWACGAVGVCGIACQRQDWLELAVNGQFGDRQRAGFIAQISQLFSPSGYYDEGPYYQRFAIQPMLLFAEALERAWPELGIYRTKDEVIRRGFYAALYPSFPDGTLVPLNDAIKPMNIRSLGFVIGASLIYRRYAHDARLLWLAGLHQQVWGDGAGLVLSDAYREQGGQHAHCEFPSIELSCGPQGEQGAIGILRSTEGDGEQSVLTMDYGTHGLAEHAHFDGLTLGFYSHGQEVLRDYGCVRWINVEPKQGGCYLPENNSFAKQTIAHNTITVDETCQHGGDAELAASNPGIPVQFCADDPDCQVMSGEIRNYSPGVTIRRTSALLHHPEFEQPLLIDLCRVRADAPHQYDYALYYQGQVIRTDFPCLQSPELSPLGTAPGYRHLWRQASGFPANGRGLFSWLQRDRYYSLLFASSAPCEFIMTRIGANDPDFNLRAEPGLVIRQHGQDVLFASVLESHGYFDESTETSRQARGRIIGLEIQSQSQDAVLLKLQGESACWQVGVAESADQHAWHEFDCDGRIVRWLGGLWMDRD